jgi:guanylate kinase
MVRPLIFIISGPAGAGKTTLCRNLVARCGEFYTFAVTTTTRPPRPDEVDGRDYFFVDREEFSRLLTEDAFFEHSTVHGIHLYGLTKREVQQHCERGSNVLLTVDVQGAKKLHRLSIDGSDECLRGRVVTIFLLPPSMDELRARILRRGPVPADEMERRLHSARLEMESAPSYDYTIPPDTADETLRNMQHICAAEHMRNRSF